MTERAPRLFAAFLIALALIAAAIPRNWFVDDAYITFRFAENLARGRERIYAAAAAWVRQALPPGEMMASNEIGGLAYYSDRKVLDLFGLAAAERRDEIEAVRIAKPALLLFRDHFPDQARIEAALPRAYRWQKWRNLWIGVRADLPIEVSPSGLERIYRELPI
jgi:hypothetical protein